jgi:GTPase SAR1 family protein
MLTGGGRVPVQTKTCLLGAFGVGKTSLVDQLVRNTFSHHPRAAVGVRFDKGTVDVAGRGMNLIVWDLHSEEDFRQFGKSYLHGAAGCMLVVDGTRPPTLDDAVEFAGLAERHGPDPPTSCRETAAARARPACLVLLNKADLTEEWRLEPSRLDELDGRGLTVLKTSARTGRGVTEAFAALGRAILEWSGDRETG